MVLRFRILCCPAAALLLAVALRAQDNALQTDPSSIADRRLAISKAGQPYAVECRTLRLTRRSDRSERTLTLLRDPLDGGGLAVLTTSRDAFGLPGRRADWVATAAIRMEDGVLRAFIPTGYALLVAASTARFSSLDAEQAAAMGAVEAALTANSMRLWWATEEHWIDLLERLPKSVTEHIGGHGLPDASADGLERLGTCWSLTIRIPNAAPAAIAVDRDYDLTQPENCAVQQTATAHVKLLPGRQSVKVRAFRDNKPAEVGAAVELAEVTYPDGRVGQVQLHIIYDQARGLFWWAPRVLSSKYPGEAEREQQVFTEVPVAYIAEDRIAVFGVGAVQESTERFPDFGSGEAHVLTELERLRGAFPRGEMWLGLGFHLTGIPSRYFSYCLSSFSPLPSLVRVGRSNGRWELTLQGNGRTAVLSLDAEFQPVDVRLSAEAGNRGPAPALDPSFVPLQPLGLGLPRDDGGCIH